MIKKRKKRIGSGDNSRENETDECVNEMRKIDEQLRTFILGENAKVSKSEVIMSKIGEYECVLSKLLCKNERLENALAVYERIGVSGAASGGVNQSSESMKVKFNVRVPEKKNYAVVREVKQEGMRIRLKAWFSALGLCFGLGLLSDSCKASPGGSVPIAPETLADQCSACRKSKLVVIKATTIRPMI
ncbi:hypothetical protein G5I_10796 [Acromyrmex echinatior]|uniref:Uncharacterized protein n=1 Tax=Acromyrmex echinatior TaxID=103372 RepID=F4WXV3_ACREC|nr:hypothetical protein G5I_10796 [Acromyrmex echinatior]